MIDKILASKFSFIVPLIAGLFYTLSFPVEHIIHFFPLGLISLALLFYLFEKGSIKNNVKNVLLFSVSYCLSGYYWIPYTLTEFGNIPFPFNYLLGVLFSLIILPQFVLLGILYPKIRSLNYSWGFLNLLIALIATMAEYYIPQQFPAHPGHSWMVFAPNLGLAPIGGVPLYSFFSYWISLSLIRTLKEHKKNIFVYGATFIFVLLNFSSPLIKEPQKDIISTRIRMVQGHISNLVKISAEKGYYDAVSEVLNRYRRLSIQEASKPLDLIIWPETAYPNTMVLTEKTYVPELINGIINQTNSQLITGGYTLANKTSAHYFETEYNSILFFDRSATFKAAYHKQVLIPFGESLPFGALNPYLAKVIKNVSFFAKGSEYTVFKLDNKLNAINAICYEILFSSYMRTYLNNIDEEGKGPAHFIINLTNDSWYGDTLEPYQHRFLAHWRALEFGIPIVRVTNTGITSVLYPDGSESQNLGLFKEGIFDITLKSEPNPKPTLFKGWGTLITIALALILIIINLISEKLGLVLKKRS